MIEFILGSLFGMFCVVSSKFLPDIIKSKVMIKKRKGCERDPTSDEQTKKLLKEYQNFLTYDGTEQNN